MSAGQTLIAYTTGLTDTLGRLQDSEGIGIIADNNAGDGNNFRIAHTVEETGTYYITVSGSSGATGNYRLSVEIIDPPEPPEIYRHITIGFDWGSINDIELYNSSSSYIRGNNNQFSLLRLGYSSHRGKGIVGFGYKGNLGISLQQEVSYSGHIGIYGGREYGYITKKASGTVNRGFANQIHVGQFFGASFKIIDKGAIRWFAAVGLSMDVFAHVGNKIYGSFFGLLIGPELNSYLTYMFNPSFGLSLGGNFAYNFLHFHFSEGVQITSAPSGGFEIFVTFAPQGVKPRDRRLPHGDR